MTNLEVRERNVENQADKIWEKFLTTIEYFDLIQDGDSLLLHLSNKPESIFLAIALEYLKLESTVAFEIKYAIDKKEVVQDTALEELFEQLSVKEYIDINEFKQQNAVSWFEQSRYNKIVVLSTMEEVFQQKLYSLKQSGKMIDHAPIDQSKKCSKVEYISPLCNIKSKEVITLLEDMGVEYKEEEDYFAKILLEEEYGIKEYVEKQMKFIVDVYRGVME